jgi:glutamate-5-semialdehyde dehydrogenase
MRSPQEELAHLAYQSYIAGQQLTAAGANTRSQLLSKIAHLAKQSQDQVLEANTFDLVASREMAVPEVVGDWLKLTPARWQSVVKILEKLAHSPDPLLWKHTSHERPVPLGTIAFAYEGLVQLAVVASAMAFRSGNSILLKGGTETSHTQQAIVNLLRQALKEQGISEHLLVTTPQGAGIKELLSQDKYIKLLIPYGRPSFVQQLCKQATVSVLPTALGNCYLYLSPSGNLEQAKKLIQASHQHEPDPIVAIEKVVIHERWLEPAEPLIAWISRLQAEGITVRGCDQTRAFWRQNSPESAPEVESVSKWEQSDLDGSIGIKIVNSPEAAIAWINQYSSGHADCALTDSLQEVQLLAEKIHSSTLTFNNIFHFDRTDNPVLLGMSSIKMRGAYCHTGTIDVHTFTARKTIFFR